MSTSIALENLRRDLRTRIENDPIMSTGWVAIPLLLIVSLIVFIVVLISEVISIVVNLPPGSAFTTADLLADRTVVLTTLIYSITAFVLNVLLAWMMYKLIRRRNTHFGRQQFFYEDIKSAASELATKKGVDASIPINNLDRTLREARLDENAKNPVLWIALTLASTTIPSTAILRSAGSTVGLLSIIALLYVYYFLTKDFYKHERREDQFIRDLLGALAISGLNISLPYRNPPMPERSFALYVVLTIVTAGFFWVYWIFVLLNDPNHHFRQHMIIEDTLMAQLSGTAQPAPIVAPPS